MEINYEMLVNKSHKLENEYINQVIIPSLVSVDPVKNNEAAYRMFGVEDKKTYLEKTTAIQFKKLSDFMKKDKIILGITSGYLSLEQQGKKYDYFVEKRGKEFAEKSACLPGYSEHNTGLALDADILRNKKWAGIAPDENGNINEETKKFHKALSKFGFILRYPKGKEKITQMKFEPWHIRYVGENLAKFIEENALTLEEYYSQKDVKNNY